MNEEPQPASLPEPILKDKRAITLYQIAVLALAAIGVITVLGAIVLAAFNRTMPDYVVALASVAVGGLVALVANNRE